MSPEEPTELDRAMRCAEVGSATRWPIAAGILRDEVLQLQSDLRVLRAGEAFGKVAVAERNAAREECTLAEEMCAEAIRRWKRAEARIQEALAIVGAHDQPDGVGSLIDAVEAALKPKEGKS